MGMQVIENGALQNSDIKHVVVVILRKPLKFSNSADIIMIL